MLPNGRTWLPPVLAGSRPFPPPLVDPETGIALPQPGFPSAAVAPDGSVYVAFEASTSSSSGAIGIARSRDAGRTWTSANLPGVTAFAFEPAVAVDAHGTVGVTWYDLRNDRPGDAALSADVWFANSQDRGRVLDGPSIRAAFGASDIPARLPPTVVPRPFPRGPALPWGVQRP